MAKDRTNSGPKPASMAPDDVRRLAQDAIRRLAEENGAPSDTIERRLQLLCEAYLANSEEPRRIAIERLRREGVPPVDIIDTVLPEVARMLGRQWADDIISFADVTIGSARLQETLRSLSNGELSTLIGTLSVKSDIAQAQRSERILMIIPRPEHHTLGTFIAADQLRRLGYVVDVAVDQSPKQIAMMVRKHGYSMVGITAAGRRTLASARELVDIIRTTVTRVTPVVLGGSLVGSGLDLKGITGADHVTNDIRAALSLCGMGVAEDFSSRGKELGRAE